MKVKNLCLSIFTCFCAISASAMDIEQPNQEVQQGPEIQRQRLFFPANTGYTSETILGKTYAHYPIKLSNGNDVRITFLTEIVSALIADNKQANISLQPKDDRLVANLSCANIRDDAVTDWYMQMFGLSGNKETDKNIHVSLVTFFSNTSYLLNSPIRFDESVNDVSKNIFVDSFRKIATTPVGRVLLYRILIELTRCSGDDRDLKWADCNMVDREGIRYLNVVLAHASFPIYFSGESQDLNININDYLSYCSVNLAGDYRLDEQSFDVALFNKLNVWYHCLLDKQDTITRFSIWPNNIIGKNDGNICEQYGITTGDDLNAWWYCSIEYIRSVLGELNACYGLSLSENAYRFSRNFERCVVSNYKISYPCVVHWGEFYDSKIRPNIVGVKLAIQNARQCVYNITGTDVLHGLKL